MEEEVVRLSRGKKRKAMPNPNKKFMTLADALVAGGTISEPNQAIQEAGAVEDVIKVEGMEEEESSNSKAEELLAVRTHTGLEAAGSEPNSTKKVRTSLIKESFNKAGEIEVAKLQEKEEQVLRNVLNPKAAMETLVQLVTVRNLPHNCNTWPELHTLLMAANYTAEELINTSHGHVQKPCSNSYAIHKDIFRKKLQSSPAKLHLSADVWSTPNHKAFLGICVQFMQEDTKNPCQALLALSELPGIDSPGSHSEAEQWKLLQPVIEDHIVNLCVQAFLFMDSKEAVLEVCRQIEEMDQASLNIDMMQGWKKRKERGWSQLGPLGKLHNAAIHIRANDYRYNLFRRRAGKVLGLDNDTRWNSWFLLLDAALDQEEHIKWYQDKYFDALVDDYSAPQD
ncbi:hypothetical protein BFJ69_g16609 [Fusarium oxysporum]|uniref:Uncharacterized protein n=1 Tax=Fusarium oxysporum TaxID=5507 RepID=A0A420MAP5_FUSOX|nr:hypothetical protein BFJ69_g16609 [Fusarium oxysporum]